jgi:methylmalonyl-CoA mutase C-terminal domain/subunit
MTLVPRILELLAEQSIDGVIVTVGGTIPQDDIQPLKEQGVAGVFTPGATTESIIEFIREGVRARAEHPEA